MGRPPRLIETEIDHLKPDLMAFNEVCIPRQSARELRNAATALTGIDYNLVQQTRVNGLSKVEGEALFTRFSIVEIGNFDYQAKDTVALVARVVVDGTQLDVVCDAPLHVALRRFGAPVQGAAIVDLD